MANIVSGTFTGTGNSAEMAAAKVLVDLTFSGTATVNAQWLLDTTWRTIAAYTESSQFVVETYGVPFRLNCSAHTNNVTYTIRSSA